MRRAVARSESDDSSGKVYVFSQVRRVVRPKMPALGCWEAWMCVSLFIDVDGLVYLEIEERCSLVDSQLRGKVFEMEEMKLHINDVILSFSRNR